MKMQRRPRLSATGRTGPSSTPVAGSLLALALAFGGLAAASGVHAAAARASAAEANASRAFWQEMKGTPAATAPSGARASVTATRMRTTTLDRLGLGSLAAAAPAEGARSSQPLVVSLPDPDGGFQRFAIVDSPVMEAGLAAKHPNIRTYAGKGLDDTTASMRMSITPLGVHVSVRSSAKGSWYIDPYYHLDTSLYASYYRRDVPKPAGGFSEALLSEPILTASRAFARAADSIEVRGSGFAPGALVAITVRNAKTDALPRQTLHATADRDGVISVRVTADPYKNLGSYSVTASDGRTSATTTYEVVADNAAPTASSGPQLRTYRLALITDPSYATYFGGPANVTPAKVVLMNRVTQMYEYDSSIRLVLINDTDKLNLDTAAMATGTNGPCGGSACFTTGQLSSCGSGTLTRNRIVAGLLAGAGNFDIGHLALGVNGGGIASLGVVGGNNKAQGCTGLPQPTGDFFAIDYVAHEMGHQFAANHTFNGTLSNCSGSNRSASTSVEPGSGSSIMAYAGICGNDNLQPHSDPYWSYRSFEEITAHTSAAELTISEVQVSGLYGYSASGGQLFQLRYGSGTSVTIGSGGTHAYTTAGVKAAIEAIPGWPAGGTVTISALSDTTFTVTFGGTLSNTDVPNLELVNCTGGCSGFINDVAKGGPGTRQGSVQPTGNTAPVVAVPASSYTIPLRTPFALTGSATDVDGDPITYMWEQTDRGAASGVSLVANNKATGPLFRQFGTRAVVSATDALLYNSPGQNNVDSNPTRVFPDLAQILINNTNAETGTCTMAGSAPTAAEIDCFSEYLPTASYTGFAGTNASPASLNFRLTARDGKGGVNNATVQLVLASGTGPFLVTSPNTAVVLDAGSSQTVTWNVAGTNAAPINTSNVRISLSVDGGLTYPHVLAASTPNDGSETVMMPMLASTTARVKVEAIGNVFFDVSNANFTIRLVGDLDGDGRIDCADLAIVRAALGTQVGQPGFDPRADVNNDGVVDVRDLSFVSKRVTVGVRCS